MAKWTKEEKNLSDKEFPYRSLITVPPTTNQSFFLSPGNEVLAWCFENFGITAKPPLSMIGQYSRKYADLPHEASGAWMIKTSGRNSVKFYFREHSHAVMFELRWREEFSAKRSF